MAVHPLSDKQKDLLEEYKNSKLSMKEFAKFKVVSISTIYYLVDKERRIEAQQLYLPDPSSSFVSVSLANKHEEALTPSSDIIAFIMNGIEFKMTPNNLKIFIKAIK